jgi:hypothetical protein
MGAWHDPELFPDMTAACERIHRAVAGREKILIYATMTPTALRRRRFSCFSSGVPGPTAGI